jgi:RNA polymerase sigma-70 factor (ECF subfamily)
MNLTEANILRKLKEGDEDTYVLLFREYYVPLCNYSRRFLGRKDLAEDIVSETFFNIWTKREILDIRTSLKAYFFQAVGKNSLYYLRKAKKEEMLEDYLVKHSTDNKGLDKFTAETPSDLLLMKDLSEKIQAGIDRLPPQQQTAFKLKRYEGKKNREIAEIMGLSVKTVEMHLAKAMLSLRTYLKDYIPEFLIFLILKDIF